MFKKMLSMALVLCMVMQIFGEPQTKDELRSQHRNKCFLHSALAIITGVICGLSTWHAIHEPDLQKKVSLLSGGACAGFVSYQSLREAFRKFRVWHGGLEAFYNENKRKQQQSEANITLHNKLMSK